MRAELARTVERTVAVGLASVAVRHWPADPGAGGERCPDWWALL